MKAKLTLLLAGAALLAGIAIAGAPNGSAEVETQVLDAAESREVERAESASTALAEQAAESFDSAAADIEIPEAEATGINTVQQAIANAQTIVLTDQPVRDGAIPDQAPEGFETGWDIEDVQLTYDPLTDELHVLVNSFGVLGDPEGNGDPSTWAQEWIDVGFDGTDEPNLGGTEFVVVVFDIDQDGSGDIVAGVPQGLDISGFSINELTPGLDFVPFVMPAFGAPLPNNTGTIPTEAPDAENPDLEFTISNLSTLTGSDGRLDLGVNAFVGSSSDLNIGEDNLTAAGSFLSVPISADLGDQVFLDENANGINDPGEPGVPNVAVTLFDETGELIDVTDTDENGNFGFVVNPGTFTVGFDVPDGLSITTQFTGADTAVDSNADPATGRSEPVTLGPGDQDLTIDAGLVSFVPAPGISIEKATNGQDADDAPGVELIVGETAEFTFVVANTGNVPLADITVNDDVLGFICDIANLQVGDSETCETTATVEEGQVTNVATATGQPLDPETGAPIGDPVTDDDPSNHTGIVPFIPAPGISIEKATNGQDADDAPGVELIVGETAEFTFVVANTGNVPLADITVNDDVLGFICDIANLQVGDSETCETTATVEEGQVTNVATATGQPLDPETGAPIGDPVTDDDPSNHIGIVPGPPCVADIRGPRLFAGDRVIWDTGYIAEAGSTLIVETEEPGGSPGQPNEQVYVFVGDVMYGPTPIELGTIEIDVSNTGRLSFVHYSVVTGDTSQPNSVEIEFCGTGISLDQGPACQTNIEGPRLHAGGQVEWNSGIIAEAGSTIRITTTEPGESPDQPNEQVWVRVGEQLFGPTPIGLGTIEFTADRGGEITVLHFSRVTGFTGLANSVEFELCGTHLR